VNGEVEGATRNPFATSQPDHFFINILSFNICVIYPSPFSYSDSTKPSALSAYGEMRVVGKMSSSWELSGNLAAAMLWAGPLCHSSNSPPPTPPPFSSCDSKKKRIA
jgi:hypothetical protein